MTYPTIVRHESEHKLVSVRTPSGREIRPSAVDQMKVVFTKELASIGDWDGRYEGVQANISYEAKKAAPVTRVVFNPTEEKKCSVKSFMLAFYKDINNARTMQLGTGIMTLKKGSTTPQVFEFPEVVEAHEIRIIVMENYGDDEQTCFSGATIYRV